MGDRTTDLHDPDTPATSAAAHPVKGEKRWPMALAVIVAITLTALLPSSVRPESTISLIFTGIVLILLIGLIAADPGRIDRRTREVHIVSRVLLTVLAGTVFVSTILLLQELVVGDALAQSATELLLAGGAVWMADNIVFALMFWEIDGGGSAARAVHATPYPDFAFPQHMNPQLAPEDWRPLFVDYLYLGFTNALAFSPTDVMPLSPRAKVAMVAQSLISLAILGLVVARAVNILS